MAKAEDRQKEVDTNFDAFQKRLPDLLKTHAGKFAVLRRGEIIQFFDSAGDAFIYASDKYDDGLFSIQEVTDEAVDLGFYSHALSSAQV